jgi:CheY-like chemotaxis protein
MLSPVSATQRLREPARKRVIGYQGPRRTILIVDDDPLHVAFVSDALASLGFAINAEDNGQACLNAAARARPDAILLDISMAGIDGWETARRLRAAGMRMPIVMISADPRQQHQPDGAAPYDAYLMKPLRISALLDSMKRVLDLQWISDEGDSPSSGSPDSMGLTLQQVPFKPDLVQLRELGEIGHLRGILAKLDEIGAVQPSAAAALGHLRRLAEDCDLDAYKDMIEALESYGG